MKTGRIHDGWRVNTQIQGEEEELTTARLKHGMEGDEKVNEVGKKMTAASRRAKVKWKEDTAKREGCIHTDKLSKQELTVQLEGLNPPDPHMPGRRGQGNHNGRRRRVDQDGSKLKGEVEIHKVAEWENKWHWKGYCFIPRIHLICRLDLTF